MKVIAKNGVIRKNQIQRNIRSSNSKLLHVASKAKEILKNKNSQTLILKSIVSELKDLHKDPFLSKKEKKGLLTLINKIEQKS